MPHPILHEVYALYLLLVTQRIAIKRAMIVHAQFPLGISSIGGLSVHFSHRDGTLFKGNHFGCDDILDILAGEVSSRDSVAFPALECYSFSILSNLQLHTLGLVFIL